MAYETVLNECTYDPSLVDGDYQSSFLFVIADEIKIALDNKCTWVGAVSMLCAIEVAGRESFMFIDADKRLNNTDSFNYFISEYMGYSDTLKVSPKLYDDFRNGLVHNGFPKAPDECDVSFGIGYNSDFKNKEQLKGLNSSADVREIILDVLLLEFIKGIVAFRKAELENGWRH